MTKSAITTTSYYSAEILDTRGSGGTFTTSVGIQSTGSTGQLFVDVKKLYATSVGVGSDGSTSNGHIHLNIEDLYLAGTQAAGIRTQGSSATSIVGYVHHIIESGSYTDTVAFTLAGGRISIVSTEILCDILAYVVQGSGSKLDLICPYISVSQGYVTDLGQEAQTTALQKNIISSTFNSYFYSGITSDSLYSTSISAATYYSGSTELGSLFGSGSATYVQPGTNVFTGGTASRPIVHVLGSPTFTGVTAQSVSGTSISATTYYSGATELGSLFAPVSVVPTYVQPGTNVFTGGTALRPVVHVLGSPVFTSVTAVNMTAVTMSANSLVLESYSSNTTSDTASGIRLYDRSKAGRNMLETKDAAGIVANFQTHMGMSNVRFVKALGNGGTTLNSFGLSPIIGGTAQPKTYSTSSLLSSLQRVGMRTTATSATSATIIFNNGGAAPFWLGNTTNAGGFHAIFRFGIAQAQTNMRWFVGMYSAVTSISNVEPTNLGTILGFGINSGETTVRFMNNDGSGVATTVDLGSGFPATTANVVYEAHLYVAPNSTTINYYLERLDSTEKAEGSVTTNIPPSTVFLTPHLYINNSSTSADAIMDFIQIQVETKY